MIVVIPTNRKVDLGNLVPLIESRARFIIVDDSEGTVSIDHPQFTVYNWKDRRRMLGPLDEFFPRRNGACRAFGFYVAWHESDPGEAIIALDDDCRVYHEDFAAEVELALSAEPRPVVTCLGDHLNILDLYTGSDSCLFPRGFPYSARGVRNPLEVSPGPGQAVAFNLGLWRGIFDINAVDKITGRRYDFPDAMLQHRNCIIAPSKLISICSMNMHFRREVIPALYQFPMNVEVLPDGVIDRYGDIWGGFVLKVLLDLRGNGLSVGEPMIIHTKEGNYLRNIWQENLCHQLNDEFLRLLAEIRKDLQPAECLQLMEAVTIGFRNRTRICSLPLQTYMTHLTAGLSAWTKALQ